MLQHDASPPRVKSRPRSSLELEAELQLNVAHCPSAVCRAEASVIRLQPALVQAAVGVELAVHHRQVGRAGELHRLAGERRRGRSAPIHPHPLWYRWVDTRTHPSHSPSPRYLQQIRTILPLALLELVRFLRMQRGAGRVSLLSIEFRQAPVDDGAARIDEL